MFRLDSDSEDEYKDALVKPRPISIEAKVPKKLKLEDYRTTSEHLTGYQKAKTYLYTLKGRFDQYPLKAKLNDKIEFLGDELYNSGIEIDNNVKQNMIKHLNTHPDQVQVIKDIMITYQELMGRQVDPSELPTGMNSYAFIALSILLDPNVSADLTMNLGEVTDEELDDYLAQLSKMYDTLNQKPTGGKSRRQRRHKKRHTRRRRRTRSRK